MIPENAKLIEFEDVEQDEGRFVKQASNGDLMTIEEFVEACQAGGFIDYDGMGDWATATHVVYSDITNWIKPSKILSGEQFAPEWATHVLWYNR